LEKLKSPLNKFFHIRATEQGKNSAGGGKAVSTLPKEAKSRKT